MLNLSVFEQAGECGYCSRSSVPRTVVLQVCADEKGKEHTFLNRVCENCREVVDFDDLGGLFVLTW